MTRLVIRTLKASVLLLLFGSKALAQPGSSNFNKVWVLGSATAFTVTFDSTAPPVTQILKHPNLQWFTAGNSSICDSAGNPILISDGYNLYNKDLNILDNSYTLVPWRMYQLTSGFSWYSQSSIILPFGNGKYRLITSAISDDSCAYNCEKQGNGAYYDLLLYHEVDMNANGGAGRVTKRMAPLLQNARLSKTQMMACRHGDGKSWWLLKQAADTNLVYKFLFTENQVYGPYIQGFSGAAGRYGELDVDGQCAFSKDGTKYATTVLGFGKVFVADFDRCTGMLSNPQVHKVPAQLTGSTYDSSEKDSSTVGLCFSPNGRFLYVSGSYNIQQLDLQKTSSPQAWTHLSGIDTTWQQFMLFSSIYPGHDGKLYIGNASDVTGQMSVINAPDSSGFAAGFCRKCLRFPGYYVQGAFRFVGIGTPPCMPDYSLGRANPICSPTGMSEPLKEGIFMLYPNPSSGTIEVRSNESGTLGLYDMAGRAVTTFILPTSNYSATLSIANLSKGIYQYRFADKSGQHITGKLVVIQ